MDWNAEALETDSFADVVDVRRRRGGVRFRPARICRGLARRASARPAPRRSRATTATRADHRRDARRDRLSRPSRCATSPRRPARRSSEVERGAGAGPGLDPPGVGARIAGRMPRAAGQGRRPLRPGDGAADRQSRPAVEGPDRATSSGSAGSTTRTSPTWSASFAPTIPSPAAASSAQRAEDVTPDVFVRRTRGGYAVELNQATLPRLLVNRRYYQELKTRAAGQGIEGLAQRMPGQRQLAGQGARPARADDRQGRQRDRQAPAGLLRARRRGAEAADPARGRRGDRNARIDRQPGDLEQISAVRPRAVRAQIFLRLGRRLGRGRGRARPKRSRRRSAS